MKQNLKVIVLVLVFVLPVVVFIFLKLFGSNSFDIPIMSEPLRCDLVDELNSGKNVFVVNRQLGLCLDCNEKIDQLKRINQRYPDYSNLGYYIFAEDSGKYALKDYISRFSFSYDTLSQCLPTNSEDQLLLIDQKKRVRGIYSFERAEIDRLMTELEILYGNTNR